MKLSIKGAILGLSLSFFLGGQASAAAPAKGESCGEFGTSIQFHESPSAAAKAAKRDGKLLLVLHVSGHFEDPTLT
jgi:hypothetical protein